LTEKKQAIQNEHGCHFAPYFGLIQLLTPLQPLPHLRNRRRRRCNHHTSATAAAAAATTTPPQPPPPPLRLHGQSILRALKSRTRIPKSSEELLMSGKKPVPPRGKAFVDAECVAIVKAMLIAKNNPRTGAYQGLDDFHQHFKAEFDKIQEGNWPDRVVTALVEKYGLIRRDVHKFQGQLDLVKKERNISGVPRSEQGDVDKALSNFLKTEGKYFQHYSCYPLLKDQFTMGLKKVKRWCPNPAALKPSAASFGSHDSSAVSNPPVSSSRVLDSSWDSDDLNLEYSSNVNESADSFFESEQNVLRAHSDAQSQQFMYRQEQLQPQHQVIPTPAHLNSLHLASPRLALPHLFSTCFASPQLTSPRLTAR
jgi:hypothetical protein